ncbi:MAG TPA: hypothetical protein VKH19_18575 [Gemmatimonadaceae bacterium]|nr:hypothetical protein [Gemmatimonadaceae bacterium]
MFAVFPSLIALVAAATLVGPDTGPPASCAGRKAGAQAQAFVAVAPAAAARARDTSVTATVCVMLSAKSAAKIGSYHGELQFDSTVVSAVRVVKADGGMRVENATQPGRVNFAGASPAGFPEGGVVRIVLRLRKPGVRPALHLEMKELNTTEGADLMKELAAAP